MRHVSVSVLAIVAIVAIATLMFSVVLFPGPSPFALVYVGQQQSSGNTVIARLDINEFLGDEVPTLNEYQLSGLKRGTVHGKRSVTDYSQTLKFKEPGSFNGGKVVFGRNDDTGAVSDFLQFDDAIFKLQLEFGSGLQSKVEGGKLPEIEDEDITIMGDSYAIVDTSVDTSSHFISIRMFGGFGSIELTDNNYADDAFTPGGARINGKTVDADVKIKATDLGGVLSVYSIQYILNANGVIGGRVQVLPLHCTREYIKYPQGMISPNFDMCYKGVGGAPAQAGGGGTTGGSYAGQVWVKPSGDEEYAMIAVNTRGQLYRIPVAQLPGSYGNRGRPFIFVEAAAPGAPNIAMDAYFLVNSRDDISGVSNVLHYSRFENDVAYFDDLAGGSRQATVNSGTMEGDLLVGEGTYHFKVGAGNALAMDQNNDGAISGGEAVFVIAGGQKIDFGPGFIVKVTTPSRLFNEPMGDETTQFMITFGSEIDLQVPTPQGFFTLTGAGGGVKQGLTRYGILWTWTQRDDSDDLKLEVPGAYSGGGGGVRGGGSAQVYISLERSKLMKKTDVPAPTPKCGDGIIMKPEYCDPPGSLCAGANFDRGVCSKDCLKCDIAPKATCGNGLLEKGEECEANADCAANQVCNACKCVPAPAPVCGNKLLEPGEQCEAAADCAAGFACQACACVLPPPVIPLCSSSASCRVYGGCGATDSLMKNGVSQGCVDPTQAAAAGIQYCGKTVIGVGARDCSYMTTDPNERRSCICPAQPEVQVPSPVPTQKTYLRRFLDWLKRIWNYTPAVGAPQAQVPAQTTVAGVNCANAAPCRLYGGSCGQGFEPLMADAQFKNCVDANVGASQGIPYCGHRSYAQNSRSCSYMSTDPSERLSCVCN